MAKKEPRQPTRTALLKPIRIEASVTEQMDKDLTEAARAAGQSKAEFIRDAIKDQITRKKRIAQLEAMP